MFMKIFTMKSKKVSKIGWADDDFSLEYSEHGDFSMLVLPLITRNPIRNDVKVKVTIEVIDE